ncbi:MAG TPA: hypothetical protein DEQ58_10945 [Alcanivorax sp.]|nr:hypothetical protein [Alcanivorax sp.]
MSELIQYQRDDGIVTLTLNSPETRNPISDDDMIEALACGLVSRVVPDDQLLDEARALAQRIAVNPTQAVRMTKRLLWAGRSLRLDALLEMSAAMQALAHSTSDHQEAVQAFIDKRAPDFTGH